MRGHVNALQDDAFSFAEGTVVLFYIVQQTNAKELENEEYNDS
jgi:hypothetical protein